MCYRTMNRNEALYEIKKILPENPVTCEIGFFKGEYSKSINEILKPERHYVIDTFSDKNMVSGDKDGNSVSYQDMTLMDEYSRSLGYITIKGDSEYLGLIPEFFDFVYIDADHSYDWVSKDLRNAIRKMKTGAVLAGHDYSQDKFPGCYRAVNDFCDKYHLSIFLITNDGCPSYFIKVP